MSQHPHTCKGLPPDGVTVLMVQDGWTEDGRRNMVEHRTQWLASVVCGHDKRATDPDCQHCERSRR